MNPPVEESPAESGRESHGIDAERAKRLYQVLKYAPSKIGVFREAYAGKSLRAAINAFCIECNGYDVDGIRRCSDFACLLWEVRPYRVKRTG